MAIFAYGDQLNRHVAFDSFLTQLKESIEKEDELKMRAAGIDIHSLKNII
ncbi:hypothetical protein JOD43_003853 [Pullulanibacillus pueri]|uniref:Uncharacterized protein n=1 Tax=Pullulanibacillus pueri TaxID=1437324 RepID=A0A8J3ENM4_9BACL|nr:hypothetical protein [Pullulanibacillus pueri]MBM7683673.1 hypothetical protein [Pullulanibacillus pueri]GGH87153.1 hypothetical protein GCM10007096_36510 [Pullulanibacillus pueri]